MAHLEDEAVDLARSLQFTDARLSQQAAQHTVVAFEQLRKNNAYARLLDDERPELGHDDRLSTRDIAIWSEPTRLKSTFEIRFKNTLFR